MNEYCVAVVNALRARLFTLEGVEFPELESGPRLVEQQCLVNPDKEVTKRKVFAGAKPGFNRTASGAAHSFDDHRARHELDFTRRFARKVATASVRLAQIREARYLVIAADRRMLGLLRGELAGLAKNGLEIRVCDKEMTKLTCPAIHHHLARQKLIPPCRKPSRT
jgi:hypothetical protein